MKSIQYKSMMIILLAAVALTGVQTAQLYSIKNALAKEGLGAVSGGGGSVTVSQSSAIPDQVGGCFRG